MKYQINGIIPMCVETEPGKYTIPEEAAVRLKIHGKQQYISEFELVGTNEVKLTTPCGILNVPTTTQVEWLYTLKFAIDSFVSNENVFLN